MHTLLRSLLAGACVCSLFDNPPEQRACQQHKKSKKHGHTPVCRLETNRPFLARYPEQARATTAVDCINILPGLLFLQQRSDRIRSRAEWPVRILKWNWKSFKNLRWVVKTHFNFLSNSVCLGLASRVFPGCVHQTRHDCPVRVLSSLNERHLHSVCEERYPGGNSFSYPFLFCFFSG